MKNLILFSVAFLSFAFSLDSQAFKNGGWVSSGGELFRDAKNPWFLRNTSEVNYCINIDTNTVSASKDDIRDSVQQGFIYWHDQFAARTIGASGDFTLATQKFTLVDCSAKPDLTLQFGYGTLSPDQLAKLERPERYIGVTVRTEYDLALLKGKGFIYFSSDMGTHAYDDDQGSLITKAWSRKKILQYAILHELGHVFGLPHMGSSLMSEVFLNQILNKQLVDKYEQAPIDSFIQINRKIEVCGVDRQSLTWFAAPSGTTCLTMETFNLGNWKVFAKKAATDTEETQIGEFQQVILNLNDLRSKPSMFLQLTSDQKVFTSEETNFRSFMMGPMMMDGSSTATYFAVGSPRPQSALINFTPQSLSVQGLTQNKIQNALTYNSPLSVLLLISPKPIH